MFHCALKSVLATGYHQNKLKEVNAHYSKEHEVLYFQADFWVYKLYSLVCHLRNANQKCF